MHSTHSLNTAAHLLRQQWARIKLRRPEYSFLLDTPPANEWVSLDCETTGLNTQTDNIIAIGAVRIAGNTILASQRLELLVQPQCAVSRESIRIHRLRQADVQNGLPIETAMRRLLHFIGSRPLVGYYLEFDVAMLNRAIKPMLGITLPQQQVEVSSLYYDYKMRQLPAHQRHDGTHIDLRFATLMQDLQLPTRDAHDALNDAVMAAMAFIKLRHLAAA